jgi:formylaminopyrimidine deformylase / aminopyrimidine aminohydrolase
MTTTVHRLAHADPQRWQAATRQPFLDGVRDGTLPVEAFDRWLEQDRLFVEALARAWGRILHVAPTEDLGLLADGISAFAAEVAWFDQLGAERGLTVPAEPLPVTDQYNRHLLEVASQSYPVALAAMFAVEVAYLEAWRSARPGHEPFRPFVEHWTDDAFAAFVGRLEQAADRALADASAADVDAAAAAVAVTFDHEAAFWAMTWHG